jgi:hypothetical protein
MDFAFFRDLPEKAFLVAWIWKNGFSGPPKRNRGRWAAVS